MSDAIKQVKQAIREGDKKQARRLLRPILQGEPTADAWTLAAMVTDTDEQAIQCLKRALAIDEWHTTANRMLSQLQSVGSAADRGYQVDTGFQQELAQSQQAARAQGSFFKNLLSGFGGLFRRDEDDDKPTSDDEKAR